MHTECGCFKHLYSQTRPTNKTKTKQNLKKISISTETTALVATQQSLSALALSCMVRMNWGHTRSAVKSFCSFLTVHTALCIVFVSVPRSGEHLANVGRKKCSDHIWERWLMFGPLGSAVLALSNPGAFTSSAGACRTNTRRRTVKTHLVTERRADWEAVIRFTDFWLLGAMCSLRCFLCLTCITACLWMCPTYSPYMKSVECFRRLHNNILKECVLYIFSSNQTAKTWKCGDKERKQHMVIEERVNRKQYGLGHWAVSWKINECSRGPNIKIASLYISSCQGIINYQPTYNCFQKNRDYCKWTKSHSFH